MPTNEYGQPVGETLSGWERRDRPGLTALSGPRTRLEPLRLAIHGDALYEHLGAPEADASWTYLSSGPFESHEAFLEDLHRAIDSEDRETLAILDANTGAALGMAAYMRIDQDAGSVEVGHIHYGPQLKRSPLATEAMYLMMAHVFDDLGYRRYEWKCNALNEPSRRAALRLGFHYEGTFRQALVSKGRNRDTAWFSIIDSEWPDCKRALERWLDPGNFDADGKQRQRLVELRLAL